MRLPFPHYNQLDAMDCGPTCLRMIARHYGRSFTNQTLLATSVGWQCVEQRKNSEYQKKYSVCNNT